MSIETDEDEVTRDESDETPNSVLVTAAVCSFVIGALAAYTTMNLGTPVMAASFIIAVATSGYYLAEKELPMEIVGLTSYAAGGILVVAPSVLYLSDIIVGGKEISMFPGVDGTLGGVFGGETGEGGVAEIDSFWEMMFGPDGPQTETVLSGEIDALMPLVAWTVVFMIASLVLFAVGAVLRNRAEKERREREQRER